MADEKPPFPPLTHAEYSKLTAEEKMNDIDAMPADAKQQVEAARLKSQKKHRWT